MVLRLSTRYNRNFFAGVGAEAEFEGGAVAPHIVFRRESTKEKSKISDEGGGYSQNQHHTKNYTGLAQR